MTISASDIDIEAVKNAMRVDGNFDDPAIRRRIDTAIALINRKAGSVDLPEAVALEAVSRVAGYLYDYGPALHDMPNHRGVMDYSGANQLIAPFLHRHGAIVGSD